MQFFNGRSSRVGSMAEREDDTLNRVSFFCTPLTALFTMVLRPQYGTRFISSEGLGLACLLMVLLPVIDACVQGIQNMIPFSHPAPNIGMFGFDTLTNPSLTETLPQRYVDLAIAAFQAEQISEGQLAKYLRTNRLAARELVEAFESRIHSEDDGTFSSFTPDLAQALGGR